MIETNTVIQNKKEKAAALLLAGIPGIGSKIALRMVECAGNAEAVLAMPQREVNALLGSALAKRFIKEREEKSASRELEVLQNKGMDFIPFTIKEYPERLRHIPDPPFGLYVKGGLPKEGSPTVAIVGARACSEYGKKVAYTFGKTLGAYGVQVISGMARGIDGIAQRGALDGGGETYAVLGCGADCCYPPENESLYHEIICKGGVLSEYAPGTQPQNRLFPARNRIISGLADIIVVVEARKRSGTYITVMQALEQNREVYAVPGRVTDALSDGCNYLLSQGAGVAVSPELILGELEGGHYLNWSLKGDRENTERAVSDNISRTEAESRESVANDGSMETIILSCLDITPLDIESIYSKVCAKRAISIQECIVILTKMQILGKVENSGNYYRLSGAL